MPYIDKIEQLLADAMADGKNADQILDEIIWWIYETDFGKKKDMAKIYLPNTDKPIIVTDTDKFYRYLVNEKDKNII